MFVTYQLLNTVWQQEQISLGHVLIESTGSWSLSTLNIWLHSILFIIAGLATQNVQLPVLEFLRTCPALKMLKDIICPSPRPWSSRPGHWPGVKSLALTSASCMEVLGNFKDAVTTPITLLSHRLVYRTRCLWTSHHFTVYYSAKHRLFFFCTMLNAPDSPFNRMYYMMWFMFLFLWHQVFSLSLALRLVFLALSP